MNESSKQWKEETESDADTERKKEFQSDYNDEIQTQNVKKERLFYAIT